MASNTPPRGREKKSRGRYAKTECRLDPYRTISVIKDPIPAIRHERMSVGIKSAFDDEAGVGPLSLIEYIVYYVTEAVHQDYSGRL